MDILKKIKNSKNVIIVGRGPSSRFYKKKNNKDFLIGINLEKINNIEFDAILSNNIIKILGKDKGFIHLNKIINYKIGSIPFGLLNLLMFLDQHLKSKKIFLYGFDFKKYSSDEDILKEKKLKKDIGNIQEIIDINTQKIIFDIYKNKFQNIKISRFGFDFMSDNTKNNIIHKDYEFISEFTTNHQGNTNKLIELIECCIKANCKTIKFQKRDVENFYSKKELSKEYLTPISNNFYEYRKRLELTREQLSIIKSYSIKNDLKVIFSALDYNSYNDLKLLGFKHFKIPSTISLNKKYINFISQEKLDKTYISTGMTNEKYINFILNRFKKKKIVLMHAISAYPTNFNNINLGIVNKYKRLSDNNKYIIPGYSSHDVGDEGSMLAIAAGAKVIEKHIKIGHTDWMHFDDTAIDARIELPIFINKLTRTARSIGSETKQIYPFEHHKYKIKK